MARPSASASRPLTLPEELEKLEQSITLTLQEIDHNFSKAHRIVTSSILPVVERYAEHSKDVWKGAEFWKQFFEASANVSLSGYEEIPPEEEAATEAEPVSQATPATTSFASPTPTYGTNESHVEEDERTATLDSSSAVTPRPARATGAPQVATFDSPYESLKRQVRGSSQHEDETTLSSEFPATPRPRPTPQQNDDSSPFTAQESRTPVNDVLLHRILDKNYRIRATPHTEQRLPKVYPPANAGTSRTPVSRRNARSHDSPDSSPMMEAPQLRSEFFGSPEKKRIPGVSVLTPAKARGKDAAKDGDANDRRDVTVGKIWDSDSDEETGLMEGMSPPKTMQFHIPQSKLLRTPAREASKRIVEDLLLRTGGADLTSDLQEEDSPSIVKRQDVEEDTF